MRIGEARADGTCDGPYVKPCIEYAEDRVNIRLYQWCPACLAKLSDRINYQPITVNASIKVRVTSFVELGRRWPGPLTIEQLSGKYYGTHVVDADGNEVIEFWCAEGPPSEREKRRFGNWTQEAWDDYVSDTHWESERDYRAALEFIALIEAAKASVIGGSEGQP